MKKLTLSTLMVSICASIFAHAGHNHSEMSRNETSIHLIWIAIPIVIGIATFFYLKKKKKATQE